MAAKGKFNFDHPDAFDNELMEKCLDDILVGKPTKVIIKILLPTYYQVSTQKWIRLIDT